MAEENMGQREVPVYLFLGFVDGGKTSFIQQTLEDASFNSGERTLLLLAEQGEEVFDPTAFAAPEVELITVDQEEELTPDALAVLDEETRPERVIIEYNGMWRLTSLLDSLPPHWVIYQAMLFAEANSFAIYDKNMRPLTGDKLTLADTVIFNRADPSTDKEALHRIVRSVSRNALILYEYPDGHTEQDDIIDPPPYDMSQRVLVIKDGDYAFFYRDILAEPEKYAGKIVKLRAQAARSDQLPAGQTALGRFVMTCCEQDIAFCGFLAKWGEIAPPENGAWTLAAALVAVEDNPTYGRVGPVLYVGAAKPAKKPKQEVATFY